MNRRDFGQWGLELNPNEFAEALAMLLRDYYFSTPVDILAKLAAYEIRKEKVVNPDNSEKLPIKVCLDSTYHFLDEPFRFEIQADQYSARWGDFVNELKEAHFNSEQERSRRNRYGLPYRDFFLRFELYTNPQHAWWLSEQLSNLEPNVSVYLRIDNPTPEIGWNWPLRVGFLPDENSRALLREIKDFIGKRKEEYLQEKGYWLEQLVEFVTLDSENDSCDLLIIPAGLCEAINLAVQTLNFKISADCALIIGPNGENPEDIPFLIEAFRRLVDTAGVGIADLKPEKRVQWLVELTRFLSHDEPIDVSLFAACRQVQSPPPFLSASRQLVEFSRLSESVKLFGKKLLKMEFDEGVEIPGLEIDGEDAWNFGMNEGIHHLKKIGDEFSSTVDRFRFDQESTSATSFSKIKKQFEEIQALNEKSKKNQTRWIQAQVYDLTDRTEQTDPERKFQAGETRNRLTRVLRANAPHEIVIRIGPESETWIQNDEEFNPEDITLERDSHELTVVFTEPQLFSEPQVALITLPPRGASSLCSFLFQVGESVQKIEGRISIVYKNRVLQTALLRADVTAFPESESENRQISLTREAVVRADFDGLSERRNFDAAFILNEDVNNRSSFTAIRNQYVSFTDLEWLQDYTDEIDRRLRSITEFPEDFTNGLNSPATVELMSVLAKTGWLMYKTLIDFQDGFSPLANIMVGLTSGEISKTSHQRIQIISAKPKTRLPFEFIYDRTPPSGTKVKLCPRVTEALEQGHCLTDCPGANHPEDHVCPLGFWGLSKVIERHTHNILYTPKAVDGEFRFQSEPAKERPHLQAFKKALFAASDRADVIAVDANGREKKGGHKRVLSTLNKLTNSKVQRINSWVDWCQKISSDAPSMLVLLTHTEKTNKGFLGLEIKDGKDPDITLLEMANIDWKHVRFPKENFPPPMVLLIGCETGKADKIEFMDFVTMFRQSGAGIIVSTGIPIYGWDAVSLTNELLMQLQDIAAKQETSFGEVMRLLKQKMMLRGFPVVLTLMAYGDADWKIGA